MSNDAERMQKRWPHNPVPAAPAREPQHVAEARERLGRFYDGAAAPPKVTSSPPVPPLPPTAAEQQAAMRLERFYDSSDMAKLRGAQAPPTATPPASPSRPATPPQTAQQQATSPEPNIASLAEELGLDPAEVAQSLQGLAPAQQAQALRTAQAHRDAATTAWREQSEAWAEDATAQFTPRELARARNLVRLHGGDELMAFFDKTQVGNHPALVRLFVNLAERLYRRPADDW